MEFEIKGKGIIKVLPELYPHLREWYLVEPGDFAHKNRKYVDENWFYEKLKNNEEGIYRFASILNYIEIPDNLKPEVQKYLDEFNKETDPYGFDTFVYMEEVFMQKATGEKNLHWW